MPTIVLKDGRSLSYESYGDTEHGTARVIFSHGLSDSRLLRHWDDDLTKSLGVHIVAVDQPGVGSSSPVLPMRKRRTLKQYADDVRELVDDHLQWTGSFQVAGHSGGGPHALALAYYLGPDKVTGGVLAAPAPPMDESVPGILECMGHPFLVNTILWLFRNCSWFIYGLCDVAAWWANRDIAHFTKVVAASDGKPETFLGHPKQQQVFEESFRAGLVQGAAGIQGMLQVGVAQPWGFDIHKDLDPSQHFDLFMSDLDPIVPPQVGDILCQKAALPNATSHVWENAGHYSFVDRQFWIEFWTKVKENGSNRDPK